MNRKIKVDASKCSLKVELSLLGALEIVEDLITDYMQNLKIDGVTTKAKYNSVWVFTKSKVEFLRQVKWNEELDVEVFISSLSMFKLCIDVAFRDTNQELVLYARVEMCSIDLNSFKIKKTSEVGASDLEIVSPLKEVNFKRFEDDDYKLVDNVIIKSSNIDFCMHTNNIEYLRFIYNTYSVKELVDKEMKSVELHYLNQSFENDELNIYKFSNGLSDDFKIMILDKEIVRCEIN